MERAKVQFQISKALDIKLREMAKQQGLSYSALLNRLLRQGLDKVI